MKENECKTDLLSEALDQSLELNKIQAGMLKEKEKTNRSPWIAFFVTLGILFLTNCAWMLLWNQYDTMSSYEANGIYALIDSNGNILAQDITQEQLDAFKDWWEINGKRQSEEN